MAKDFWINIDGSLHNISNVVEIEQIRYYRLGVDSTTDDLARLQAENKRLRDALAFYANEANNHREITAADGQVWPSEVANDGGLRAQQALDGKEPVGYEATAPADAALEGN